MGRKLIDITGRRFGQLVVIKRAKQTTQYQQPKWQCRCDCGAVCYVRSGELRYGDTTSCGCYNLSLLKKHNHTTHTAKSRTYRAWSAMRQRCENVNCKAYPRYGGRGIVVCKRWQKFENFLEDMGELPPKLTLERKNNNGPYVKWNCVWATWAVQNGNRRWKRHYHRKYNLPQGVNPHKEKFTAAVTIKRQRFYLGIFSTPQQAQQAIRAKVISKGINPDE